MDPAAILQTIIEEQGAAIWISFISFIVTGFVLVLLRDFVGDIVLYYKARISDIGFGQQIYYQNAIYIVKEITFRHIIIYDSEKVIRVPIKAYLAGPIAFPNKQA